MTFTTLTFALFFLGFFPAYWALRERRHQNWLVLAGSYFFYGWWDWRFCGLMALTSLLDFSLGQAIHRTTDERRRRQWLVLGLTVSLGVLGYFKYFNFFATSARTAAQTLGWELSWTTVEVVLPVGISFYTFQSLSYLIDVYRRQITACDSWADYFAYVSFFPQLVAGPIERATNLLPQFGRARIFDYAVAVDGCRMFLWGLVKKLVVAGYLSGVVDGVFSQPAAHSRGAVAAAAIAFTLQIYCDFSAYSEMAAGLAKLLGFRLMRNFAHPLFSQSVGELWRRWHISLSTWFKDYVYVPLGGNRGPAVRRTLVLLATFTLSGLWHGAAWKFVLWGALNALAMLPELLRPAGRRLGAGDTPGGEGWLPAPGTALRMAATFLFLTFTFVFFRANSLGDALVCLERIFLGGGSELGLKSLAAVLPKRACAFAAALFLVEWCLRRHAHPLQVDGWPRSLRWALYSALFWLAIASGKPGTEFIYFQF